MAYEIDLKNKVAVITGGGGGFGLAVSEILTKAGAQVVIDDVAPFEKVSPQIKKLAELGAEPAYFNFDISQESECKALISETVKKFGSVDILVNNAGASKKWKTTFEVNLLAPCVLMEEAYLDMKKRGWGKIVNITTSGVFSGGGDGLEYNATKGGLDSATRYLAKRYGKDGVTINAVGPGPTLTAIMKSYIGEEEFESHYLPTMPIARILTTDDLAKAVLFFCSPLSDAITGESVLADGGRARLNPA